MVVVTIEPKLSNGQLQQGRKPGCKQPAIPVFSVNLFLLLIHIMNSAT